MARYTDEQKAQAVARVTAREATSPVVAADLGCTARTVQGWVKSFRESSPEKDFADRVAEITQRIEQKQVETREALIERIGELIPETRSLKDVATAYGIITDKMLVSAGKPNQIHGQAISVGDGTPEELEATVEELRSRRQRA